MGRKEPTIIVLRRMLVESKAALAGVMLEILFARLRASMAAFNEERAPFCPLGRWSSVVMVETQGSSHEKAVRGAGREQDSEPFSYNVSRHWA